MNIRSVIRRYLRCRHPLLAAGLAAIAIHSVNAAAPANNNLSAAESLSAGLPLSGQGTTAEATLEAGEWNPGGLGGSSVWYSWSPSASGWVTLDTVSTNPTNQLDTIVSVSTGTTIANLSAVGHNDQSWSSPPGSQLSFFAVQGTTYKIAVHNYYGSLGLEGPFDLHITGESPAARVTGISISPATVDVTGAEKTVTATVSIESDSPLFSAGGVTFKLNRPDGGGALSMPIDASNLISGTSTSGTYSLQITVPRYVPAGSWVPSVEIYGTYAWSPRGLDNLEDHWLIQGTTENLTVQNTAAIDSQNPVLSAFSIVPQSVARFGIVTLRFTISDAGGAGFQRGDVWLIDEGVWIGEISAQNRISGDSSNGEYEIAFPAPYYLDPGQHHFSVYLADAATNSTYESPAGTGGLMDLNVLTIQNYTILESWRIYWFGLAVNSGSAANTADWDKDGLPNLLEFATNHDPTTPDSGASTLSLNGGLLTLGYDRAHAAVAQGVQYFPEWSDSPGGSWSSSGMQENVTGGDAAADSLQADISLGSATRRFLRLRVNLPTP